MRARELRDLTIDELNQKYKEFKDELFNLRFQNIIGQLKSPARIKTVKRTIARIKTILRERELKEISSSSSK